MLRSILAVIAGSLTWMVTALGTDALLMALAPHWFQEGGRVESAPVLLLALAYSLSFSVLGGYVTALIAGRREVLHALVLGLLQLAMGIIATIQFWDTAPAWFHIVLLALIAPANVFGGYLRAQQKRRARLMPRNAAA